MTTQCQSPAEADRLLARMLADGASFKRAARAIGCSDVTAAKRARDLGLPEPWTVRGKPVWYVHWTTERDARVREMHAAGSSDREIAAALGGGATDDTVFRRRVKLGLVNGRLRGAAWHARHRGQMDRLNESNRQLLAAYPLASGLPADLNTVQTQIMNVLLAGGPMTARQLAAVLGRPWRRGKTFVVHDKTRSGSGTNTSALAGLIARGLLYRTRMTDGHPVYIPTAAAVAMREEWTRAHQAQS